MPPKTQKKETVDRSERRSVFGVVTSHKMAKTITVRVERFVQHPMFGKTLRRFYTCYAHDEKGEARSGDKVELQESRPLSKLKHWRLVRVIEKSAASPDQDKRDAARPSLKPAEPATSTPPAK